MAKSNRKSKKVGGPYLAAAVFCESIMEGPDNILSAVRIVDGIKLLATAEAPAGFPSKEYPYLLHQNMLLIFRSGDSPGKHELKLITTKPDGKKSKPHIQSIKLTPKPNGGTNLKSHLAVAVTAVGVYWIDVFLDNKLMTRMPISVDIQRMKN